MENNFEDQVEKVVEDIKRDSSPEKEVSGEKIKMLDVAWSALKRIKENPKLILFSFILSLIVSFIFFIFNFVFRLLLDYVVSMMVFLPDSEISIWLILFSALIIIVTLISPFIAITYFQASMFNIGLKAVRGEKFSVRNLVLKFSTFIRAFLGTIVYFLIIFSPILILLLASFLLGKVVPESGHILSLVFMIVGPLMVLFLSIRLLFYLLFIVDQKKGPLKAQKESFRATRKASMILYLLVLGFFSTAVYSLGYFFSIFGDAGLILGIAIIGPFLSTFTALYTALVYDRLTFKSAKVEKPKRKALFVIILLLIILILGPLSLRQATQFDRFEGFSLREHLPAEIGNIFR